MRKWSRVTVPVLARSGEDLFPADVVVAIVFLALPFMYAATVIPVLSLRIGGDGLDFPY